MGVVVMSNTGGVRASTLAAIGGTPVGRLGRRAPTGGADVLVKLEYYNPIGSYMDRMALAMIEGAEARGDLTPGMGVVEFTGGGTGSSLAFVCAVKGYPLKLVCSDAFSSEKPGTTRALGADLTVVPSRGGTVTPDLFVRMRELVQEIMAREGAYWTDQFRNADALTGYGGIGSELAARAESEIDLFCGAVGTAGMLVGASRNLKAAGSSARIVALEPAGSAFLSAGVDGPHRVEGLATGTVPPLFTPGSYDRILAIDEGEARDTASRMTREEGIFAVCRAG